MLVALGFIGINVVLVGLASFLEQPLAQKLDAIRLGARERFDTVPFFWSQHYALSVRYTGHAEQWDRIDVDGRIAERACSVAFRRNGKTLAVASVKRDRENLEAASCECYRAATDLLNAVTDGSRT